MTEPLIDRDALALHRRRAARSDAPATFLHEQAMDEIKDRLSMVNKSFMKPAVISGLPAVWSDMIPGSRHIADEDLLDLEEQGQDLIIHALSLHWANDPLGQLIQCRRALGPDGLFLAALFGGTTLHELRTAFAQAESDLYGGLSPRIVPMAEIRDLGGLLQRAGFALPVADSVPFTVSYETPLHLMRDLRAMGEVNALTARARRPMRRALLMRACEIYAESFGTADGRIPATFDIVFLTGWAPAPDQPQPLRPGSATTRLADALNTKETPLKD
ncbi:SAM-dependent methyltransferase [Roseovarius faecimaris]|uniref:SAM-dependent methyltransferase n=1 Tax=Roseovarius faecimaris TaxID=2494550 RepID=A0A6I6IVK7_9RHOB|nr:SAM-dependent methyltransferase [Roseovarius faecimaris]QGY00115.1 SAM-dependent methyltransferase [Roseovarius faecimaris]